MKKIKVTASLITLGNGISNRANFLDNVTQQLNTIEYVIYLNHITAISTNLDSGTDIRLSCGHIINLLDDIKVVEKLIEDTYNS